jgi:hypothetical protein
MPPRLCGEEGVYVSGVVGAEWVKVGGVGDMVQRWVEFWPSTVEE